MRDHLDQRHPTAPGPGFVASGSNLTITIGRNVGSVPMDDERWSEFQSVVADHVGALVKPSESFTYFGQGEWEGVTEESAVLLLIGTRYTSRTADVDDVLAKLAVDFDQDAIGWSAGLGHLAGLR